MNTKLVFEFSILILALTGSVISQNQTSCGLQCINGGILNQASCTCTCLNGYSGYNCERRENLIKIFTVFVNKLLNIIYFSSLQYPMPKWGF